MATRIGIHTTQISANHNRTFLGMTAFQWHKSRWFYVFIAPWFLGFLAFTLLPVSVGLLMSFTNFNGSNFDTYQFVGLDNYGEAVSEFFSSGDAWYALSVTLRFALTTIPINIVLSLFIAILLTRSIHFKGFFRLLFYIPSVLPVVASVWIWKALMDNNYGVVNAVLNEIVPGTYVRWMTEYPFLVLVMWSVWSGVGGAIIIFMAGIQGVPQELEEAARIDGANNFQMFQTITVPLLTPVIFYQFIVGIIGSLQILTQPILLSPGGGVKTIGTIPPYDTYTFMIHIYQESFTRLRYGYGSALLWILFALILILSLIVTYTSRYWVYYEVEPDGTS
jgi:multiple sugar transport system permease protein